jgi:hypothetical protein
MIFASSGVITGYTSIGRVAKMETERRQAASSKKSWQVKNPVQQWSRRDQYAGCCAPTPLVSRALSASIWSFGFGVISLDAFDIRQTNKQTHKQTDKQQHYKKEYCMLSPKYAAKKENIGRFTKVAANDYSHPKRFEALLEIGWRNAKIHHAKIHQIIG